MRRKLAMLLAMLAAVSSLTVPALAAEPEDEAVQGTAQAETAPQENGAQENGAEQEEPAPEPDPEGTVSWANLDERIRSGSLSARILIENITGVEDLDYDQMYEDLRQQYTAAAPQQESGRDSGVPQIGGGNVVFQVVAGQIGVKGGIEVGGGRTAVEDLHFRSRGSRYSGVCFGLSAFGLALELGNGGRAAVGTGVGAVGPGHALLCHKITSPTSISGGRQTIQGKFFLGGPVPARKPNPRFLVTK